MADIAVIFHWTPRDMGEMSLEEVARWHEMAIERLKAMKGIED